MSLIDVQRAAVSLCVSKDVPQAALAKLGNERIWRLYRELIRNRLHDELQLAFKRTHAAAGPEAFARAFEHHLETDPPRTRFFHGLIDCFARSAVPFFRDAPDVPAHTADLAAYEAALWSASDLADTVSAAVSEFDFDKLPLFTSALRLLELEHAVHRKADNERYEQGRFYVCVYRRPEDVKAQTFGLNVVSFDLVQCLVEGGVTVSDAIRERALARGITVDQRFLDGLCAVLADLLERGILLGSR